MVSRGLLGLFSSRARTGSSRVDDRMALNVYYTLVTGCCWMDMPVRYGYYSTAFRRFKRGMVDEAWPRILESFMNIGYSMDRLSMAGLP